MLKIYIGYPQKLVNTYNKLNQIWIVVDSDKNEYLGYGKIDIWILSVFVSRFKSITKQH